MTTTTYYPHYVLYWKDRYLHQWHTPATDDKDAVAAFQRWADMQKIDAEVVGVGRADGPAKVVRFHSVQEIREVRPTVMPISRGSFSEV